MATKDIKLKNKAGEILYPQTKTSLLINDDGTAANINERIEKNKNDLSNHINNKSNPHEVTKAQVGLDQVDNTSDAKKPISEDTQAALNNKLDKTAKAADSELLDGKDSNYFTNAIEITYAGLKAKRDNSQLVKGQWYRITDYQTMVDQAGLTSANHQFDLIVLATEINSLNENVFAAHHSGDTYFINNNLNAWKINYTINNDKAIYPWANANGKGVIYALEDEFNNSFPYDFKNILVNSEPILGENCKNVKVESKDFYLRFVNAIDKTNNNIQNIHVYLGLKGNSAELPKVIQIPDQGDTLLEIKPQDTAELINPAPDINYYYNDNLAPDAQNKLSNFFVGTTKDLFNVLSGGGTEHKWTDMSNMFSSCSSLITIPLVDTKNVTNMSNMFYYCASLKEIPQLDTNNATNMEGMFRECTSLITIPLLDTSKVTDMNYMFASENGSMHLKYIPLLNTSNVTNMSNMFAACSQLKEVPLFDTSNVTDMSEMFSMYDADNGHIYLKTIPYFNTHKVNDMSNMFYGCSSLISIPKLDTSNVIDMWGMFQYCSSLTTIPQLDTINVTDMGEMFTSCSSLTSIPKLDTSNVTNMESMFYNCSLLTSIPKLDTSNVTHMRWMFENCSSLISIPKLDTSNVTDMYRMFCGCSSLASIPQLDTSNVTDMKGMFSGCFSLTKIHMININADLDISDTVLEHDALIEVIDNLKQQESGTTKTLTMSRYQWRLLADEEMQIATDKGWTFGLARTVIKLWEKKY